MESRIVGEEPCSYTDPVRQGTWAVPLFTEIKHAQYNANVKKA